jgi:Spy/CpxP family protein refolding chaperone
MIKLNTAISVLCLATAATGITAADLAAAQSVPAPAATAAPGWGGHHHRRGSEFRHVLHQLNLTDDQKVQIKSIMSQSKAQHQALFASIRETRSAMAATMPNDPNYASLVATAKANAAARIQAASELKTQIYAVLTPAQQAQIPAIVAADQAAHAARAAKWQAAHTSS